MPYPDHFDFLRPARGQSPYAHPNDSLTGYNVLYALAHAYNATVVPRAAGEIPDVAVLDAHPTLKGRGF